MGLDNIMYHVMLMFIHIDVTMYGMAQFFYHCAHDLCSKFDTGEVILAIIQCIRSCMAIVLLI